MATILTRTYTYTGQSSWKAGDSSVPLSAFAVSGDTAPITQILSISASWYRYQDTSSTIYHTGSLTFANGAETLTSNTVSLREDGEVWRPSVVFPTMPDAADWTEDNVTFHTKINTKYSQVSWMATAARPMVITITYYSTEFLPRISAVMYRANAAGTAADMGTSITFAAGLLVQKAGVEAAGRLEIYECTAANQGADGTLIYARADISVNESGIELALAPIPNYTLPVGEKRWYYILFSYSGVTSAGVANTEAVAVTLFVGTVFTNVHLAGVATGGVAFGKFSAATEDNPLFECVYPAVFSGKVRFDGGIEEILDYRITETKTGHTWIDGKPIYRCVIEVGAKTASAMYVDVTSLGIETYVDLRGMFYASAGYASGYVYPAPYAAMSESYMLGLEAASRTSIRINSSSRTWKSGYLIVEYTKV